MVHRRLLWIAAMTSALAATGCGQKPAEMAPSAAVNAPKPAIPVPLPAPKLDREQLIFASLRALSAAALGQNDLEAQKALKGREFELRLRFGCPAVATGDRSSRTWSYDANKHVLRARISSDLSAERVPASDLLLKDYEGVAGFTIDRPLLLSAGCPAAEFRAVGSVEPTIALAQLFTSEDSRVQRPERSYEITKSVDEAGKPTQGLDMVIGGRLSALSDGRTIHCASADGPPACIIAAKLDRVAIENPVDGSVLGEWSSW
jgi:hypothetical protein